MYIHLFLTLALVEGQKSAARPGRFTSRTFAPHTRWLGELDGFRISLDFRKNTDFAPVGNWTTIDQLFLSLLLYDMIYFLNAVGLTPGGSSAVHIYTQTVHSTVVQYTFTHKQYTEQHSLHGHP